MLPSSYRKEDVLLKSKKKKTLRVKSRRRRRRDELETRWCRHLFGFLLTLSSPYVNRKWFLFSIAIKKYRPNYTKFVIQQIQSTGKKRSRKTFEFLCAEICLITRKKKNFRLSFSSGTHSFVRSAESDSSSANLGRCFIRILWFFIDDRQHLN